MKKLTKPIDRYEFLQARMAYLAHMREHNESPEEMIQACNLGDEMQVRLLLMTWDDQLRTEER